MLRTDLQICNLTTGYRAAPFPAFLPVNRPLTNELNTAVESSRFKAS